MGVGDAYQMLKPGAAEELSFDTRSETIDQSLRLKINRFRPVKVAIGKVTLRRTYVRILR